MKKSIQIICKYYGMFIKKQLVYRLNAGILFADIIMQFGGIIVLWAIFANVPDLAGWTYSQTLFFYGFAQVTFSLFSIFFGNIFRLGERYIVRGELSRLLVRPLNSLMQIFLEEVYLGDAGALLVGISLVIYSIIKMDLTITITTILITILLIISAVGVLLGFFLILTSLNFWFIGTMGLQGLVFRTINASRYPLTIYGKGFRAIFTWLIPFGFIGFYPAAYFIEGKFRALTLYSPIMAAIFIFVGYHLWIQGLKKYNAPGW